MDDTLKKLQEGQDNMHGEPGYMRLMLLEESCKE